MLSIVMLNDIMLSAIMMNAIIMNAIMLSIFMHLDFNLSIRVTDTLESSSILIYFASVMSICTQWVCLIKN
jgi:hypothetical protein